MVVYKCDLCGILIDKSVSDRKYKIVCTEPDAKKGSPYTMDICDACYRSIEDYIECAKGNFPHIPKYYCTTEWAEPGIRGEWVEDAHDLFASTYHCSECGKAPLSIYDVVLSPYCPHCGAKMGERREDEIQRI